MQTKVHSSLQKAFVGAHQVQKEDDNLRSGLRFVKHFMGKARISLFSAFASLRSEN
jgi:hypothetical protein